MLTDAVRPCDGCNGSCCYEYVVPVTGYDAWLIASTLHLRLEQFLVVVPESDSTPTGFLLDTTATTYSLVLNKQTARRRSPCIFLLELPGGYGRCGIYSVRPLVCQAFPTTLLRGSVSMRDDVLCVKGGDLMGTNLPACRRVLVRSEVESVVYAKVVQHWNRAVEADRSAVNNRLPLYFTYLMNIYARLGPIREAVPGGMAHLTQTWGQSPTTDGPSEPRHFLERVDEALNEVTTAFVERALTRCAGEPGLSERAIALLENPFGKDRPGHP